MPQHFRFGVLYAKDGQTSEQGTRLILFLLHALAESFTKPFPLARAAHRVLRQSYGCSPLYTSIMVLFADDDLLSSTVPQLWGAPPSSTSWTFWAIASASRDGGVIGPDSTSRVRLIPLGSTHTHKHKHTHISHLRALCRLFLRPSQPTPPALSPTSRHSKTSRSCSTSLLCCRSSPTTPAGYVPGVTMNLLSQSCRLTADVVASNITVHTAGEEAPHRK